MSPAVLAGSAGVMLRVTRHWSYTQFSSGRSPVAPLAQSQHNTAEDQDNPSQRRQQRSSAPVNQTRAAHTPQLADGKGNHAHDVKMIVSHHRQDAITLV